MYFKMHTRQKVLFHVETLFFSFQQNRANVKTSSPWLIEYSARTRHYELIIELFCDLRQQNKERICSDPIFVLTSSIDSLS